MADTRVENLDESAAGLELVGLDNGDLLDLEARGVVGDSGALGLGDSLGADETIVTVCLLSWVGFDLVVERVEKS